MTARPVIPRLPDRLVERPRLSRLLDVDTGRPVTLLEAPPGWGKTTLLRVAARHAAADRPVAWLSLRPHDDERFWSHLHGALPASLGSGPTPTGPRPDERYLARLATELARQPAPTVLIVDDLQHVRDARVLDGVDFLRRHSAGRLRLLLAARIPPALPLHRWRIAGDLTELGPAELAFTPAETAQFVIGHGLALPGPDLDRLHARTEGWPAGVRLTTLALTDGPDQGGDGGALAEYLRAQLPAADPGGLRDVLLRASILDQVSAGPLRALTGRTDGDHLLRELARTTGCVIPLTERPPTYRFHPLFRDLLRAELSRCAPETTPELHRRVARWYAAHDQPIPALQHALAGGDRDHAARLLVERWPAFVLAGERRAPAPPRPPPAPPAEALPNDPELALAHAADRLARLGPEPAERCLRRAERDARPLTAAHRTRVRVTATAFRLAAAQRAGETARVRRLATRLLTLTGRDGLGSDDLPSADAARAIALTALGDAGLTAGELDPAELSLVSGVRAAERAGLRPARSACLSRLAFLRAVRGELTAAERTARAAIGGTRDGDVSRAPTAGYAYVALAVVAFHRDRLDGAETHLSLATGGDDPLPGRALAAWVAALRALLRQARGDLPGAFEALRAGRRERRDSHPGRYPEQWCAAVEAELLIAAGDTSTARRTLAPLVDGPAGPPALLAVPLARSHLRDGDPHAATRLLPAWAEDHALPLPLRLAAGVLESLAARELDDQRRVCAALDRMRELAEPEGFRRVFADVMPAVRELLADHSEGPYGAWAAATAPPPPAVPGPPPPEVAGEPLTDRELTVLRYLQSILSNVEIAAELRLSVNTVKTHVRSIYRKLDASRRREAVRRARELRLI